MPNFRHYVWQASEYACAGDCAASEHSSAQCACACAGGAAAAGSSLFGRRKSLAQKVAAQARGAPTARCVRRANAPLAQSVQGLRRFVLRRRRHWRRRRRRRRRLPTTSKAPPPLEVAVGSNRTANCALQGFQYIFPLLAPRRNITHTSTFTCSKSNLKFT